MDTQLIISGCLLLGGGLLGWLIAVLRAAVNTVSDQFPARLVSGCMISHIDNGMIPGVLAAYAQRTQAQADLDNANASMKPTLSLEPQVTHYLNNNYSDSRELSKTQYSAWIKLEVPRSVRGGRRFSIKRAILADPALYTWINAAHCYSHPANTAILGARDRPLPSRGRRLVIVRV